MAAIDTVAAKCCSARCSRARWRRAPVMSSETVNHGCAREGRSRGPRAVVIAYGFVRAVVGTGFLVWLVAYLPVALHRVYGGSNLRTAFKLMGLAVTYLAAFILVGIPLVMFIGLSTF